MGLFEYKVEVLLKVSLLVSEQSSLCTQLHIELISTLEDILFIKCAELCWLGIYLFNLFDTIL